MQPIVSVIMPVFNSERFLDRSVRSVLDQDFTSWELLLVDDCSTDRSREVIERWSRSDQRIRALVKKTNSGTADTRNTGLRAARGRFVSFLDSDDLWDHGFLREQLSLLESSGAGMASCGYRHIDEAGVEILRPRLPPSRPITYSMNLTNNRIGILTVLIDTSRTGALAFDTTLGSVRDDYALWLDILRKIPFCAVNPAVLASYRLRAGAVTSRKGRLVRPHYRMLRQREGLSAIHAGYCTTLWALSGIRRYYLDRLRRP